MAVRIEIPTPLREHTAGKTEVEVKGDHSAGIARRSGETVPGHRPEAVQ